VTLLYNAAEDWPPAAVAGLCADLADDRLHLAWQAVTLDEGGNPIAVDHYIIYRQTVPDFVPVPGDSLAATADTFYDDTTAALKDPGVNHYYLVRAADAQGRKSAVSATVGEFDIMLRETPK
jgi:hypothetical protein